MKLTIRCCGWVATTLAFAAVAFFSYGTANYSVNEIQYSGWGFAMIAAAIGFYALGWALERVL